MTLIVGIVAILAILVGVAIVVKVLERRQTVAAAAAVPEAAQIAWPQQLLNGEGSLEPEARLRLIDDLGLIGAAWCVPLLARAYDEETDAAATHAVLRALNACRDPSARPTLERALASEDEEARNLAAEGLRRLSETN
jgi:HEAT repeat protein